MVLGYKKGAAAERELMQKLWDEGYAVMRAAGSGVNPLNSPDLIAMKPGKKLAIECKAHNSSSLNIKKEQMDDLVEWALRADADLVIAWKYPRNDQGWKGWFFLDFNDFHKTGAGYSTNLKTAVEKHKSQLFNEGV